MLIDLSEGHEIKVPVTEKAASSLTQDKDGEHEHKQHQHPYEGEKKENYEERKHFFSQQIATKKNHGSFHGSFHGRHVGGTTKKSKSTIRESKHGKE